jgi:AhpD family alkylhydroperoxidase
MRELNNREHELVALGAAIASNCVPCIEYHIPEARKAGVSDIQIKEAVQIADQVRRVPARTVLETALARIEGSPNRSAGTARAGCGCVEPRQDSKPGCAS